MSNTTPIREISPEDRQRVVADQRFIRGRLAGLNFDWPHDWGQVPLGATLLLAARNTDEVDVITMPDNVEIAAGEKNLLGSDRTAVVIYRPDGLPGGPGPDDGYLGPPQGV